MTVVAWLNDQMGKETNIAYEIIRTGMIYRRPESVSGGTEGRERKEKERDEKRREKKEREVISIQNW